MLPVCVLVLAAAHAYVTAFFPPLPELEPLFERMFDLERRIVAVDRRDVRCREGCERRAVDARLAPRSIRCICAGRQRCGSPAVPPRADGGYVVRAAGSNR